MSSSSHNGHTGDARIPIEFVSLLEGCLASSRSPIHQWLKQCFQEEDDRKEVLAMALERAWKHFRSHYPEARLQSKEGFEPWLMVIVQHCARDYLRQQKAKGTRRKGRERFDEAMHTGAGAGAEISVEQGIDIAIMLDSLSGKGREVLWLHLQGFSYKEIADRIGSTEGAVQRRVSRAKAELRGRFPNREG